VDRLLILFVDLLILFRLLDSFDIDLGPFCVFLLFLVVWGRGSSEGLEYGPKMALFDDFRDFMSI